MSPPGRILVRLPNWLGDVLMSRPLLHGLRRAAPAATVWGVGPQPLLALLERDQVLDRGIAWPPAPDLPRPAARVEEEKALDEIEAWRPELALVLPPSFSSAWFARLTRAPRRVGFRGDARDLLLTDPIHRPGRGEMHLSDEFLMLGASLGVAGGALPVLRPTAEAVESAARRWRADGAPPRPWVVLGPGAVYGPAKRWHLERYAELGGRFRDQGFEVLACGAGSDREAASSLAQAIGAGAHALAGVTSLDEQLALCSGARVTVSNDSGLAHVAAASGAPTVAIFGSTSSAWTAPLGPRVAVVQHAPVCSPCFQRTCSIGYVCLDRIAVEDVWRAAGALVAASQPEVA